VPKSGIERDDFDKNFEKVPQLFTPEEREEWLKKLSNVAVSSDAFFPFSDNVYRLSKSGVKFVAAPTGSVNDHAVLDASSQLGITFIEQPIRLFHH
jgi:phosphoribosylaminoimidazolecarboxamide formyltransferase / IMP cyclohydrolase